MASAAPVYSLAAEDPARAESAAWARFSAARDRSEFCVGWLAILCAQIGSHGERVGGALLLLGPDADGAFAPAAAWPDASRDLRHLGPAAERVLRERRGFAAGPDLLAPTRDAPITVGYPIEVAGALHGAVVLDLAPCSEAALQRAMRQLHWGSAWLVDQFRGRAMEEQAARLARLGLAADLVATALQDRSLPAAALAVANELAARLPCERASVGFERAGSVAVAAISHTATFDARTNAVRLVADAMSEVLDLDAPCVHPPLADDETGALAAGALARAQDCAVCSVPLRHDGRVVGALTFERLAGQPFDADTVALATTAGLLLGPILLLQRDRDRGLLRHAGHSTATGLRALLGPGHPGIKLVGLVGGAALLALTLATGTHRVAARTVIEGAVQRAAVAPFDGHVAEARVRAGAVVHAGDVLARLDDRELQLDHARLASEREQVARRYRQALAGQDRSAMAILAAQVAQTEAELALVDDKLARATLRAPFDGLVVSGDLDQLLGTPVELGRVLFQVAPLDSWRVVLEVDERDVADLRPGQSGELALAGLTGRRLGFTVAAITPVATAQDGRNVFRVEAQLDPTADAARLRPGMEGVGKVAIGPRRLLWIWTHSLTDWLRAWIWRELP